MIADTRWDRAIVGLLLCLSMVAVWSQAASGETKGEEYYRTAEKYHFTTREPLRQFSTNNGTHSF